MLFCAFVCSAWAGPTDLPEITTDVNNPIYYTILNTRSSQPGGYMYYAGDEVGLKDGWTLTTTGLDNKYKFYFTGSHDALYVHNAATGKKLASMASWTEAGTVWAVAVSPKGGGLAFGPQGGLNGNGCWNEKNYTTDANTSDFTTWSANDDGSIFICAKVEDLCLPETDKFYVIEAPLFENVQGVKKAIYVNGEGNAVWGTEDLSNKNFYWVPTVKGDGSVALKNLGSQTYLSSTDGVMTAEEATATIKALGDNSFNIKLGGNTLHANNHSSGNGAGSTLTSWGGGIGSASAWKFVEKADPDAIVEVEVIYNFMYKGVEKTDVKQTVTTFIGEEYPVITTLPYGVSAVKPAGVIEEGDVVEGKVTKTIVVTDNLPFVAAADYASINNWYYIQMHSSAGYSKYIQAVEGYIEWADAEVNANEIDTYTWGFIGNPFDGFKLVNYANGNTKGVNANASANPVINPAMDDIATATAWTLKPSTTNPTAQYFCFQYPGSNQYMNAQSGKIAFWGSADQGSTMWVTERDLSGATELQAVIDQVEAFVAAGVANGTTVGYLTSESVANVTTALTAAKEAVARKTGCIEAQADLQAAVAAVKTIQPEEGKFYKIVSSCTKDHRAEQEVYVNNDGNMHFAKSDEHGLGIASAMSRVWQFVPAADGKFYIKNVERGLFMQSVGTASETDVTKAKAVTISNLGKDNIVSIKPDGQNLMHAQDNGSKIVAWNAYGTDDASAWVITEVSIEDFAREVTVGEAGYSTLVLGYNAVIPTGVEVYTVSATEDGSATLTMIEGNVLAAGEAVVLKNAGTYDFKYTTAEATEVENLLKGTTVNANIAEASYVLGNIDGVGFYTATFNVNTDTSNDIVEGEGESAVTTPVNDAFKNNAFKAYLPKTNNAAQTLRFNFGETTGIEGVIENTNANAVIFDLSGRRVAKMQKGIYIVNGKKVYVK